MRLSLYNVMWQSKQNKTRTNYVITMWGQMYVFVLFNYSKITIKGHGPKHVTQSFQINA